MIASERSRDSPDKMTFRYPARSGDDWDNVKETDMKHALAAMTCAAALVASLAACGGGDEKSGLPTYTGGSTPTSTATTKSAKTPPTATATKTGPATLAAHSTYTYGGLKVVVNLPADIPAASRPSLRLFSEFLQADARTTARSKLDPSLMNLASADVLKDTRAGITPGSVRGIGSVTYTVGTVQSAGTSGYARITGCVDQSKIVHVRSDGSRFVDPKAQKYPRVKVAADINLRETGLTVTGFTSVVGSC